MCRYASRKFGGQQSSMGLSFGPHSAFTFLTHATVAGSLSFLAGTSGTQTVSVVTNYDFTTEAAEKFTMTWTSASIKVSPLIKTGTIKANNT